MLKCKDFMSIGTHAITTKKSFYKSDALHSALQQWL